MNKIRGIVLLKKSMYKDKNISGNDGFFMKPLSLSVSVLSL